METDEIFAFIFAILNFLNGTLVRFWSGYFLGKLRDSLRANNWPRLARWIAWVLDPRSPWPPVEPNLELSVIQARQISELRRQLDSSRREVSDLRTEAALLELRLDNARLHLHMRSIGDGTARPASQAN